jgi:uracil-DNA glycosylase family 4
MSAPGSPAVRERLQRLQVLREEAAACTACPLARTRTNVVFANGDPTSPVMFVGEGPGRDEDLAGEPFVGRSGKLLDRLIAEELGLRRADCYVANVVKCRPPDNRDPLPGEVDACARFLAAQIELVAPAVVITLGNFAARSLLGRSEGVTRLRGRAYPFGAGGQLVPTFHPAAALRGGGLVLAQMRADFVRAKLLLAGAQRPGALGAPAAGATPDGPLRDQPGGEQAGRGR